MASSFTELLLQINRLVPASIPGINGGSNAFATQLKAILVQMLGFSQAQSVANNIFVFRPGDPTPSGNVFASFSALNTALVETNGPAVIVLDDTNGPVTIPAGLFTFAPGSVITGPPNQSTPLAVTFSNGAVLSGNPELANMTVTFDGTQPVITLVNEQRQVLNRVLVDAIGTAPFIRVLGSTPLLVLTNGSQINDGGVGQAALDLGAFTLNVEQSGQSFLQAGSTSGTAAAVLNLSVLESNSFVDTIEPPVFNGTFNVSYDDLASLQRYFDAEVDPAILAPSAAPTVQSALDAFKTLAAGGGLFTDTVQTTDATPTNLYEIALPISDGVLLVQANVVANAPVGPVRAAYVLRARFSVVAGVPTVFNATQDFVSEDNAAWDALLAVVAGAAVVRVTGAAATTINWRTFLTITTEGT